MLAAIRVFAKSWVATLLIGLLIVAFSIWGTQDFFKAKISPNAVITVGDRHITPDNYRRAFDNYKGALEQQYHQQISTEEAGAAGLDARVLKEMADNEAFAAMMAKAGIVPSDALIAGELRKIPAFFNPVTGAFDEKAYKGKLAENQVTPTQFDQQLRDQIAQGHLASGIVTGLRAPRIYGALIAAFELENRQFSYFDVGIRSVTPPSVPTDAELLKFMQANAAQLKQPEFRNITVVRFSAKAIAPSLPVDAAAVQKLFEFRKDTLSSPEKRSIVQVPVKDAQTAAAVAARMAKGEDPRAVARSLGMQPVVYDDAPKTGIADPKVADAAFALAKEGDVSGPIQGELNYAVVKLGRITPPKAASLEEAKPALEAQVRADAAAQKSYDLMQKYSDAHAGGASLSDAAKAAGVMAMSLGPINERGTGIKGQPVPGLDAKLMKEAFTLAQGQEGEVVDEGQGEYFAVRVDKVIAPALPSLADFRPELTRYYMVKEMARRLKARADELTARVKKGESLEAVAGTVGAKVTHVVGLTRATAAQHKELSQQMLAAVFAAKPGAVLSAEGVQMAYVVGKLDGVGSGQVAEMARIAESQRVEISKQLFNDLGEAARNSARAGQKVVIDAAKARQTLGLTPLEDKSASSSKPAGKAG